MAIPVFFTSPKGYKIDVDAAIAGVKSVQFQWPGVGFSVFEVLQIDGQGVVGGKRAPWLCVSASLWQQRVDFVFIDKKILLTGALFAGVQASSLASARGREWYVSYLSCVTVRCMSVMIASRVCNSVPLLTQEEAGHERGNSDLGSYTMVILNWCTVLHWSC